MASSSKRERSPEEVAANVRRKPQLAAETAGNQKQHLLCSLQSSAHEAALAAEILSTKTIRGRE